MTDSMRYRVVFEGNDEMGYSAYLPELPGCVAAGQTFEETKELIAEAVELHLELMEEENLPIPDPVPVIPDLVLEVSSDMIPIAASQSDAKRTFHTRFVPA